MVCKAWQSRVQGRKSGKGFFLYGSGKKGKKTPNEEAQKIINKHALKAPAGV